MNIIALLLTCGPLLLTAFSFVLTVKGHKNGQAKWAALLSVGSVLLIATYAAFTFIRYTLKPTGLPPWKDPETLDLAMLFFLAVGFALTAVAGWNGAPKLAWIPLVVALLALFLVGVLEGMSV